MERNLQAGPGHCFYADLRKESWHETRERKVLTPGQGLHFGWVS